MFNQFAMEHNAMRPRRLTSICRKVTSTANGLINSVLPSHPVLKAHGLKLPTSVEQLALDAEKYEPIDVAQVPEVISKNPLWLLLLPQVDKAFKLLSTENANTVMVVLRDSGSRVVLKALPAERAFDATEQVDAELDAGASLPWSPLMATYLAAGFDEDQNFCAVIPYAGCTVDSLMHHHQYQTKTTAKDRLALSKMVILQGLTAYDIMQKTGPGYYHRDVKPSNICVDPVTGQVSIIDFGLMVDSAKDKFVEGFTHGYYTPETFTTDKEGHPTYYCSIEHREQATNPTTDVFLTSYMGLEVAVGLNNLPWELRPYTYDLSKGEDELALMSAHYAAAKTGYKELINRVKCPIARNFFAKTMCADPTQRLTPEQALNHEWLVGCKEAVQQAVDTALPAYEQQNLQLVKMFSEQPGILVPKRRQLKQLLEKGGQEDAASVCSISSVDAPSTPPASEPAMSSRTSVDLSTCSSTDDSVSTSSTSQDPAADCGAITHDPVPAVASSMSSSLQWVKKVVKGVKKGFEKSVSKPLDMLKQQDSLVALLCSQSNVAACTILI